MYPKGPRFIAACGYDSPTARTPHDEGFAEQTGILQALYGHKERVKIHMQYGATKHGNVYFIDINGRIIRQR
jgi:hypothetical protein